MVATPGVPPTHSPLFLGDTDIGLMMDEIFKYIDSKVDEELKTSPISQEFSIINNEPDDPENGGYDTGLIGWNQKSVREIILPEMEENMDEFEDWRNKTERRLAIIARTPLPELRRDSCDPKLDEVITDTCLGEPLDIKDRTILEAQLLIKGDAYATFDSCCGKIYVKNKFFHIKKFPTNTYDKVRMIVALQPADQNIPWTCIKFI